MADIYKVEISFDGVNWTEIYIYNLYYRLEYTEHSVTHIRACMPEHSIYLARLAKMHDFTFVDKFNAVTELEMALNGW